MVKDTELPGNIAFRDEDGTDEVCDEFNLVWIKDIWKNDYGTPFLSSIFQNAVSHASNKYLCYINTDIITLLSFKETIFTNVNLYENFF